MTIRDKTLEIRVTAAEKELIEFCAKQCRSERTATFIREHQLSTALHVVAAVLHNANGECPEFSPEVVELFTEDMKEQYALTPEQRRQKYEEWLEKVRSNHKREPLRSL